MLFVDFFNAFDTARASGDALQGACKLASESDPLPPKIVSLVRLFHANVTLEVDLDDDGNTIIITGKYNIRVKQGGTLARVLFLCCIQVQAALETRTLFPGGGSRRRRRPKLEAAGIGKLRCPSASPVQALGPPK